MGPGSSGTGGTGGTGGTAVDGAGHVVVCGLAGLGLRIVELLVAAGETVVVLDHGTDPRLVDVARGWGASAVTATSSVAESLARAGVVRALAVVCVEDDDVRNLELALLAREVNPDVRVVTRLDNTVVGAAVAADNGAGAVLDVATLAAPSVVEACLGSRVHAVPLAGVELVVAPLEVGVTGALRELYGDLVPVAVVRRAGDELLVEACPGRDLVVHPGERAVLLGTPAELAAVGASLAPAAVEPDQRRGVLVRARLTLAGLLRDADPGLRRALLVLLGLVTLATTVLRLGYRSPGMSVLDAAYFSVETVSTVGYGDFSFVGESPWLRVFAIVLMLGGITTTAVLMAFVADLLISRRLDRSGGRRAAEGLTGHVVVVGLGAFGTRVAAELVRHGRRVVVVEHDEENRYLADAAALGLPVVFGDATLAGTLAAAQVARASAVAVLTSDDMVNIETGLAVRDVLAQRWVDVPVVLRVFDRSLGHAVAGRFGFQNLRSTTELAAPWFVGAALGLDVLGTFTVEQQPFLVGRLTVRAGDGLDGLAMRHLAARTRVVALQRAGSGILEHPPRRDTRFAAGDEAYLVGPYAELVGVLQRGRAARSTVD